MTTQDTKSWIDAVLRGEIVEDEDVGDAWWEADVPEEGGFEDNSFLKEDILADENRQKSVRPPVGVKMSSLPDGGSSLSAFQVVSLRLLVTASILGGETTVTVSITAVRDELSGEITDYRASSSGDMCEKAAARTTYLLASLGCYPKGAASPAISYDWSGKTCRLNDLCIEMMKGVLDAGQVERCMGEGWLLGIRRRTLPGKNRSVSRRFKLPTFEY